MNNLVPRACDPWEGNEGSGIIRCRKPGIVAKIELRIHFNGQSESSLKRIIPEPSFPSRGSQARGTRLYHEMRCIEPPANLVPRLLPSHALKLRKDPGWGWSRDTPESGVFSISVLKTLREEWQGNYCRCCQM